MLKPRTAGNARRDVELWTTVRLPRPLRDRLAALCEDYTAAYQDGRTTAVEPSDQTDAVPPWRLIELALDRLEDHRRRSNRSAK